MKSGGTSQKFSQPNRQLRGTEPKGFIHLPRIGQVSHQAIMYFMSAGSSYCYVRFVHDPEPKLLTEGTAYFRKRLPEFARRRNNRSCILLINPEFLPSK